MARSEADPGAPAAGQAMAGMSSAPSAGSSEKLAEKRSFGLQHTVTLNSFAAPEMLYTDEQDDPHSGDHCWSHIVVREHNPLRIAWSFIIFLMLAYTASAYLYRFAFCFFHIGPNGPAPIGENDLGWVVIDIIVDVCFWIDLFVNFVFTYRNDRGREVDSIKYIACSYLRGFFWVNLTACMPDMVGEIIMWMWSVNAESDDSRIDFRVARIARLQRMSRLTRLFRLTRLVKCFHVTSRSPFMKWFQSLRGVRIVNFVFGLVWSVHLLACGWYLCAALHSDVNETWVARRAINRAGDSLLQAPSEEQWVHSMYFVLTVFTTVGFGDISAGTEAEIIYVAFTMLVGAVVHSIIVSEVIQVVTSTDRISQFVDKQIGLVEAFSEHTELSWETQTALKDEIKYRARSFMTSYSFDKEQMKDLITGKSIPRWLMGVLPDRMFDGKLIKNQLFVGHLYVPPRLPCLLAVHLHPSEFDHGEVVYQMHDFPFNLFLVLRGTFAHVALPTENGGVDSGCGGGTMDLKLIRKPSGPARHSSTHTMVPGGFAGYCRENVMRTDSQKEREEMEPERLKREDALVSDGLFPYRLCGCYNYFGDVEMMRSCPRLSTVRSESSNAVALILHKTDFSELQEQFPQFRALWLYAVRRREWVRQKQRGKLVRGLHCRAWAALEIQRFWREYARTHCLPRARSTTTQQPSSWSPPAQAAVDDMAFSSDDLQQIARKQFINNTTAKLMHGKDFAGDGDKEPHGVKEPHGRNLSKRVDRLTEEVAGLRGDMRVLLEVLNVRTGAIAPVNAQQSDREIRFEEGDSLAERLRSL